MKAAFGAFAAIAAFTSAAVAAPVVGTPFFLANPHGDAADISIASSSQGFLLGWSSAGSTWAQRYTPSAGITASPILLARGGSSDVPFSRDYTSTSRVEVVSNGADFAARWLNSKSTAFCCSGGFTWEDFGGAIIRSSGAVEASSLYTVTGSPTSRPLGAITSASPDWVVLNSLLLITPPNSGAQSASVTWSAPDGTTSQASLFADASLNAALYSGFRVASVGATALATWSPPAPAGRAFAVAEKTGAVTPLTSAALPIADVAILLAANGTDYLVVWQAADGSIRALRIASSGTVVGAPTVVWNGSDAGAPSLVTVKAAGSTYLILFRLASEDGGGALFGSRLLADGTVLDPTGFELPAGSGGALTGVADDLWLLATLDYVNSSQIIRGRYIGATTVPAPPDNVEPPPPPNAGTPSDAAAPDAAPSVEASVGGRGAGGRPLGSGGDNRPPPVGSGGRSSSGMEPIDAGSAGEGKGSATTSGGCGCVLAPRESAQSCGAMSLAALALAVGAMRRSCRRRRDPA